MDWISPRMVAKRQAAMIISVTQKIWIKEQCQLSTPSRATLLFMACCHIMHLLYYETIKKGCPFDSFVLSKTEYGAT
jgi:hypothetical protein